MNNYVLNSIIIHVNHCKTKNIINQVKKIPNILKRITWTILI